ncbi:MAG: tetratricopeptide repeat protein, partial [Myxococcales bacterium]|nr:tetratricopeptide repeat protein [Myxococcales bacterium]
DFKPENVMVADDGRVCVGDFGLATAISSMSRASDVATDSQLSVLTTSGTLTAPGAIMGTPAYMAPEQMAGGEITPAVDIFAYCVSLFEALHGARPFRGETIAAMYIAIEQGAVVDGRGKLPRRLERLLRRGLSAAREQRPRSMNELLAALRAVRRPRRRWLPLVGVGVGGAVTAGALTLLEEPPVDCERFEASAAERWSEERRAAVSAAFSATGLVHAEATAARVGAALERHVAAWGEARREVCEETARGEYSPALQDLRNACLSRQLGELDRLLDFLERADREVVNNAVAVVHGLPAPTRCDPDEVLADADRRGGARTPELDALEATIADGRRLHHAGKYDEAIELLTPVVARLEPLDAPALLTDALVARSHSAYIDGAPEARAWLREALAATVKTGNERSFAKVAADQLGLDDRDEAARALWLELGEAALARAGGDDSVRAKLLNNYGNALRRHVSAAEARVVFEQVLELRRRDPDGPELIADALFNLGAVSATLLEDARALELVEEAAAIWRRELGPQHPRMVTALRSVAVLSLMVGDYEAASAGIDESLELAAQVFRADHPRLADLHSVRGMIVTWVGDLERARAEFVTALAIYERDPGAHEESRALLWRSIAELEVERGALDEARESMERALACFRERPPPEAEFWGFALHVEARIAARRGDFEAAARALDAGRATEAFVERNVLLRAEYELMQAEVELGRGRIEDGLAVVARMRGEFARSLRIPINRARVEFVAARLLAAAGREAEALVAAEEARAAFRRIGGEYSTASEVDAWIAARRGGP